MRRRHGERDTNTHEVHTEAAAEGGKFYGRRTKGASGIDEAAMAATTGCLRVYCTLEFRR